MLTGCNLCLVLAMGVHARVQVPHLLPPVLAALADSKPNVRQAALAVMNTFLKVTDLLLLTGSFTVSAFISQIKRLFYIVTFEIFFGYCSLLLAVGTLYCN